jgi:protein MpaA
VILSREKAPPTLAPLSWTTIGSSVEGRPIELASFGTGTSRRVLVIGGVHGGEYGARAAKRLADYLHTHPGAVPAGATIDIIRCLNPDGAAAGSRGNAHSVDLNRNMPTANWRGSLSSNDQSRYMFHCNGGVSAGSEPEVKVLLARLSKGYDSVLSLHSHGGILDANGPGGRSLARRMSAVCGLKLGTVTYDAAITGSMGQYIPQKYGIPIVTVELESPRLDQRMLDALIVPAQ